MIANIPPGKIDRRRSSTRTLRTASDSEDSDDFSSVEILSADDAENNSYDFFLEPRLSRGSESMPSQASARKFLKYLIYVPVFSLSSALFFVLYYVPLFLEKDRHRVAENFFWNTVVANRMCLLLLVALPITIGILTDLTSEGIVMAMLLRGKRRRALNQEQPRLLHAIIVCNYKEPIEVLRATIQSISENTLSDSCIVVLACEDRDTSADEVFSQLSTEFDHSFRDFFKTSHSLTETEIAGKSSNENYACRELSKMIESEGIDPFQVMVTTCDADSLFDEVYFEQLEGEHGRMIDGRRFIYNAPINTYRNLPECNLIVQHFEIQRCQYDCFNGLGFRPAQSNYSLTLGFAQEIDFWDPTNTSEDFHTTLKAMATTGKGTNIVVPVWSLILNDSVCSFGDRWVQAKRHMWGIEEVAFVAQLFPVLRINQWLDMFGRVSTQMFGTCTPWFFALLAPTVIRAFFLLREDTQRLIASVAVACITYGWAKTMLREFFLYIFIIGNRKLMMKRTLFDWMKIVLSWPICSQLGWIVFACGATWRMLLHATTNETLAYITAPKALVSGGLPVLSSGSKPKKSV